MDKFVLEFERREKRRVSETVFLSNNAYWVSFSRNSDRLHNRRLPSARLDTTNKPIGFARESAGPEIGFPSKTSVATNILLVSGGPWGNARASPHKPLPISSSSFHVDLDDTVPFLSISFYCVIHFIISRLTPWILSSSPYYLFSLFLNLLRSFHIPFRCNEEKCRVRIINNE